VGVHRNAGPEVNAVHSFGLTRRQFIQALLQMLLITSAK
jgi:hypothetical protein